MSETQAGWELLPDDDREYDRYWEAFCERFQFEPGVNSRPAIREPVPSVTFDLSAAFGAGSPSDFVGDRRVNTEVLQAFRAGFPGERIVVLNWNHPAHWLLPHHFQPKRDDDWAVPVFPNGDYYMFLTEDMANGTFGHPWEQTLCVFGQTLLDEAEPALSCWLPVSRRDGRSVTSHG